MIVFVSKSEADYRTREAQMGKNGNWQELLEQAQAAQSLMLVVSWYADEQLWTEVLNLGGFDVLALRFDRDELRQALSWALWLSPRASLATAVV